MLVTCEGCDRYMCATCGKCHTPDCKAYRTPGWNCLLTVGKKVEHPAPRRRSPEKQEEEDEKDR